MQAQKLQIGAETIAVYESKGKGPAALLIHGNSCSSRSFQHQLGGALGERFRLVAMDLPGHGQSSRASNPQSVYNMPGYARVVKGVVEQLGLSQAVIVGWSLGGHIALEAVNQLPDAAGFMIFGTPPLAFPPAMADAFLPNPAMGAAFNPTLSEDEARGFAAACLKPGTAVPDFYLEDIRGTDGQARALLAASIAPNGYTDEVQIVAQMKQPLAILHGEYEQLVNLAYFKTLKMPTLWHGDVQVIAGAGHSPHWEQPEKFNALLEAFLSETAKSK
jgi:pimeloyl-ACP methyl ester carboxylesterase